MRKIKIKAVIARDFHTKSTNIFVDRGEGPEISKSWEWDGDILVSNIQTRDEFSTLKLEKGDYITVEIIIKDRTKKK